MSPQIILDQRQFTNCIARFFQNPSTFLGWPRSAYLYAWYVPAKALVLLMSRQSRKRKLFNSETHVLREVGCESLKGRAERAHFVVISKVLDSSI